MSWGCTTLAHVFTFPSTDTWADRQPFPMQPCNCGQTKWPTSDPRTSGGTLTTGERRSE